MNRIQWERSVPIYKNRFILEGILKAVGVPFGGILILVAVLSKGNILGTDTKYIFGMVILFSLLCTLLVIILYCGRYAPGFIVDDEGIINYSQQKQAKKNRIYNMILIVFGLFRGSYAPTGTGFLPQTRTVMKMEWKNMRKARYYPKQYAVIVQSGLTDKLAVFCTKDNYEIVARSIKEKIALYRKVRR